MVVKTLSKAEKQVACSAQPITYKNTKTGQTWTALPGEPSRCFQIQNDPHQYSADDFFNLIRNHVGVVTVVDSNSIVDGGEVSLGDALFFLGEEPSKPPVLRLKAPSKQLKVEIKTLTEPTNWDKVKKYLKKNPNKTKNQIREATGVSESGVALAVRRPEVVISGQQGPFNKYKLK